MRNPSDETTGKKRKTRRVAHADNSKIFIFLCTPQLLSRSCSEFGPNFVSEKCPFSELGPKFVSAHRSLRTKMFEKCPRVFTFESLFYVYFALFICVRSGFEVK